MDFVKVDDDVLLARRDGEPTARPLVFVNALGTDLRMWQRLTRYLTDRFHVVRYDMRGQGLSTFADGSLALDGLADDLGALMDQLDTGPAVVVGCELGALVAVGLAKRRPELANGLVLVGAGPRLLEPATWRARADSVDALGLASVADAVLAEWLPEAFRAQRPDETRIWRNMLLRTTAAAYVAGCRVLADADVTAAAGTIQVPTLVVTGAATTPERLEAGRRLAELIEDARLETVADAALLVHVAQPAPVAAAMTAFFESCGLD